MDGRTDDVTRESDIPLLFVLLGAERRPKLKNAVLGEVGEVGAFFEVFSSLKLDLASGF
jgi:hypothetical protein